MTRLSCRQLIVLAHAIACSCVLFDGSTSNADPDAAGSASSGSASSESAHPRRHAVKLGEAQDRRIVLDGVLGRLAFEMYSVIECERINKDGCLGKHTCSCYPAHHKPKDCSVWVGAADVRFCEQMEQEMVRKDEARDEATRLLKGPEGKHWRKVVHDTPEFTDHLRWNTLSDPSESDTLHGKTHPLLLEDRKWLDEEAAREWDQDHRPPEPPKSD